MKPSSIVALVVPLALGCNHDQPHEQPTVEPAAAAVPLTRPTAQPPAPFTGALTVSRLVVVEGVVHPRDPWPTAFAKLEAAIGAPTKVDGASYTWAAMTGDACALFVVEQVDGAVGTVKAPSTSFSHDPNRQACLDVVGKGTATEDPSIDGPVSTANEVKDVVDNAPRARSKWDGKLIRIAGKVTSGSHTAVTLADARDARETINALLKHGSTDPKLGQSALLECTVKITTSTNGVGESRPTATLKDCTTLVR